MPPDFTSSSVEGISVFWLYLEVVSGWVDYDSVIAFIWRLSMVQEVCLDSKGNL